MKMSFACEVGHEPEHQMVGQTVRRTLERGMCPICPSKQLEGAVSGGLDWARCPCCESRWRLDDEGFALRPGRIFEEWT